MLHFKRKTSTTFVFVCLLHNPADVLYRHNFSVEYRLVRLRGSSPVMHVHACYLQDKRVKRKKKIREFLSYKEFNLIKFYFSVHKSACVCFQLFQCLTISGDTSGSSGVRCNYCKQVANRRHISARERYSKLCVKWQPAGVFPIVASLPPKNKDVIFRRERSDDTSVVRRLVKWSLTGGQKQLKILNNHL